MSRMMRCPVSWLPVLLLAIGNVGSLAAQLERAPTTSPTVVAAVASLTGWSDKSGIWLQWPPAAGAGSYRVTRVDNSAANPPEVTLYEGPSNQFVFEGSNCSLTDPAFKNCVFVDARTLYKDHLYSYRVWTGGGPSPVATVKATSGCDETLARRDPARCAPYKDRPVPRTK